MNPEQPVDPEFDHEHRPDIAEFISATNYVPRKLRVPRAPDLVVKDPAKLKLWTAYWSAAQAEWDSVIEQLDRNKKGNLNASSGTGDSVPEPDVW